MRALIAGGGIAGLATGIALRNAGHEVDVFERTPDLREIGAGLMMWPNGTRALHALGVDARATPVKRITLCSWRGRRLTEAPVDSMVERYGSEIAFIHRADLQAALAAALGRDALHLGGEVADFAEGHDRVEVRFRDGGVASGDLLVGADGLRSAVRRRLLGDGEPVYLGSTIWRGIVSGEGLGLRPGSGINWIGRGSEFLAFYLSGNLVYWAGVTKEPQGGRPGPEGHKHDVLDRFRSWVEPVPALLAATPEAAILRNDMYDRPPAKRWSRGRVTLVGDAAHPMTPNQGQGACQALEDAVAIGRSLHGASEPIGALGVYERERLRRANHVVRMSRQASRATQVDNPLLCAVRDGFARLLPRAVMLRMLDASLSAVR